MFGARNFWAQLSETDLYQSQCAACTISVSHVCLQSSIGSSPVMEPMKFRTTEPEDASGYGASQKNVAAFGATAHEYPVLHFMLRTHPAAGALSRTVWSLLEAAQRIGIAIFKVSRRVVESQGH
jgi:hypothetical protein